MKRRIAIRVLVTLTLVAGVNYVVWRWLASVNWGAWWISVPLVLAETYALIDAFPFGATMWRIKVRGAAPPPPPDATVDVLIRTYNEPVELVGYVRETEGAVRDALRTATRVLGTERRAAARQGSAAVPALDELHHEVLATGLAPRGPRHDAAAAAPLGAGHDPGDAAREPARQARPHHRAAVDVLRHATFFVVGYGEKTWRGHQYSLALFPLWIRACATAFANVLFGKPLGFAVTPKTRQGGTTLPWRLVTPQLTAVIILVGASIIGLIRLAVGHTDSVAGTLVNVIWVGYDLLLFSVLVQAGRYRPDDRLDTPAATPPTEGEARWSSTPT